MTFFRYARTKGGGMGYFVLFYPVLHCRNALNIRYLLYYTHNIAQSALCRLWRAANVCDKQTQSTPANNTTRAKIRVSLCLCFALFVCLFVCQSLCLSLFVSLSVCFPVPFCLIVRVNGQLNSYTER